MLANTTRYCLHQVIGSDAPLLGLGTEVAEEVIDQLGNISVCRTLPGCYLQTLVRGDLNMARGIALKRLTGYVEGSNAQARTVRAARPVIQEKLAESVWLVRIRLLDTHCVSEAPAPWVDDVELVLRQAETVAISTMAGRPGCQKIADAASAILAAVDGSPWSAIGRAHLRLHCAPALVPFLGSFEVAIPVA